MKSMRNSIVGIVCGALICFMISCATTNQGYSDEELFPGEGSESGSSSSSQAAEEAEVLRLLGITDAETETDTTPPTSAESRNTEEWQELEEEVSRLETEVSKKDHELANLKARLNEKESTIQEKEQSLEQIQGRSSAYDTPSSSSFKAQYDQALSLYNNRDYNSAIETFNQLLNSGEDNSLIDNCQYWKGECYYGLANYDQAILEFEKVFFYVDSNKLDDAQLKLGLCYKQLGQIDTAIRAFEKLINDYPDSEYVGRAQEQISHLKM